MSAVPTSGCTRRTYRTSPDRSCPSRSQERSPSDPGVAAVAKVKLLVVGGMLVFGLDPSEFAYRRFVVVSGRRAGVMAGDHSDKKLGEVVRIAGRSFTVAGIYHSGDRFEDLGVVLPLHTVEALAHRPAEITSIGVTVKLGDNVKAVRAASSVAIQASPRSRSRATRSRSTPRAV